MTRKILISVPDLLLVEADAVAACESRTRSDLVREAIRRYVSEFNRQKNADGSRGANVEALNRALARTE